MATCTSCGAAIDFITSATSGKPIPVDVPPLKVVTKDGAVIDGFVSHFATCPTAGQHRKARTA